MANKDIPNGLKPNHNVMVQSREYTLASGLAAKDGDTIFMSSGGLPTATPGLVLGVAAGDIIDISGNIVATSTTGSKLQIYDDQNTVFISQISIGAATDPYTTKLTTACFDVAGSSGAQYINAAASTNDLYKVVGVANEPNGSVSAFGAYQKVLCMINPVKHFRSSQA